MKEAILFAAVGGLVLAGIWLIETFENKSLSIEGQLDVIAREASVSLSWQDPWVDVTDKACPLLDAKRRQAVAKEAIRHWVNEGSCLFQERLLIVTVDPTTLQCKAEVGVPAPTCAL